MGDVQNRLTTQTRLEIASGLPESQVHFQPPTGIEMVYPAITYFRKQATTEFADNLPYRRTQSYTVTVIHRDPDNEIRAQIAALARCKHERSYPNDGLNHDVFTLSEI